MNLTSAIILSAFLFGILGLVAAFGVAAYTKEDEAGAIAFVLMPAGGVVLGTIVGCIGAILGKKEEGKNG